VKWTDSSKKSGLLDSKGHKSIEEALEAIECDIDLSYNFREYKILQLERFESRNTFIENRYA